MKTTYSFDHSINTLTASDAFMKAASHIGTPEYKILHQLRRDFGDINYEIVNPTKKAVKSENRITFTAMKQFIGQCRDAKERLAIYENVYALSKAQSSPYHYVKKWFLDNYANYSTTPEFDEDGFVIVKTKAQMKAEKEASGAKEKIASGTANDTYAVSEIAAENPLDSASGIKDAAA